MTRPDQERQFELELEIQAPRDIVWEAISTDAGLRRWFAPKARIDLRPGGECVWSWKEHFDWVQRIEIVEPGARLRSRYDSPVDDGRGGKRPLFIDFLLEGDAGTTTLRLVQSGFGPEAAFDDEYHGISRGWPIELQSLRMSVEQHRGAERQLAWTSIDVDLDPPEAWSRLTGPMGLACGPEVESLGEGDAFGFTTHDGDRFAGRALECHVGCFSGEVDAFGGSFLRTSVDAVAGKTLVWCWLASWSDAEQQVGALEQRWHAMLERLFPTAVEHRA